MEIKKILQKYNDTEINRIKDYLVSEIDNETVEETISFVNSKEETRAVAFQDILYEGKEYDEIYLDGNQYLINEKLGTVTIIDYVSEQHGVDKSITRVQIPLEKFITIIENKKKILDNF